MSQWIWEPPAPWEREFQRRVGSTPLDMGITGIGCAQFYMHTHGLHYFQSIDRKYWCSAVINVLDDWPRPAAPATTVHYSDRSDRWHASVDDFTLTLPAECLGAHAPHLWEEAVEV